LTFDVRTEQINGMDFAYLDAGGEGPLAMCLHGFPDTAYTWRYLLPELVREGFHAVAPFMRGYAPTQLPPDGAYQVGAMTSDVNLLHDALGGDGEAVIIGSDLGALAVYAAIGVSPGRWRRAATLAAIPHSVLDEAFFDYEMMRNVYYVYMLQTSMADEVLDRDPWGFLKAIWNQFSPGLNADEDLAYLKQSLPDRSFLEAATKGFFRDRMQVDHHLPRYADEQAAIYAEPTVPLLYMHGRDDGVTPARLAVNAEQALGVKGRMVWVEDAGHFLHLDQREIVNREILEWIAR
jgi:pimeloyl-ACP methyl ester carboxylesterase